MPKKPPKKTKKNPAGLGFLKKKPGFLPTLLYIEKKKRMIEIIALMDSKINISSGPELSGFLFS